MALKTWDQYVQEADRAPLQLAVSPEENLTLTMPTTEQVEAFNKATVAGDVEGALVGLLGDEVGKRVSEIGLKAPSGALQALTAGILQEFGLSRGKSGASSS